MSGSYQFENLHSREIESQFLAERAQLRLHGFPELLKQHGFPEQGDALEVGTGQGIRSRIMAQKYPGVKIDAIDRSEELLALALCQSPQLPNLSFRRADITQMDCSIEKYDFIYARLVFMHLSDPLAAFRRLQSLLRPNGRLLIEDADRDCMHFVPSPFGFQEFWQKVQDGQRNLGGDPNIGSKLAYYFKMLEFKEVKIDIQPIVGGPIEIDFLTRTLMPSLNLYLSSEDQPKGRVAISRLQDLAKNPNACFYHFWFAVSGGK